MNFWNRKSEAAKKWRYRAWLIDPKVTRIIISKKDSRLHVSEENSELEDLDLEELVSSLYFPIKKSAELVESCSLGTGALLDME